jgi:oligosaccharide translocation protein RFT1
MSSNAGTATLLLLLQLGSRIVTFSLNQALLGFTTPAAFGTATIHLEPLLNTVLFLSREGIRSALVRTSSSSASGFSRSLLKISLIPLALGIPLSAAGFAFYRSKVSQSVLEQPFFATSVVLYALATCLELASEPLFIRAQILNNVKLRVSIEGTAVVARAIVTLAVILYGRDRLALVAFGAGQVTYAAFLLVRYLWFFRNNMVSQADSR